MNLRYTSQLPEFYFQIQCMDEIRSRVGDAQALDLNLAPDAVPSLCIRSDFQYPTKLASPDNSIQRDIFYFSRRRGK